MSEKNAIEQEIERHDKAQDEHLAAAAMLRRFVAVPGVTSLYMYGGGCGIPIDARTTPEDAISCVSGFLRAVGVREAQKEFDENSGSVKYVIESETLKPWGKIVISAGKPKYCEVERYEVEEVVPQRVEKRAKYRLVDPACIGEMK